MLPKNRPPSHPGEILFAEFLKPLGLTQELFAKYLSGSWTQSKISEIIYGKRRVTEVIALDFADALGVSPEFWMNLQTRYDLWQAKQRHERIPLIKINDIDLQHLIGCNIDKSSTKKAG